MTKRVPFWKALGLAIFGVFTGFTAAFSQSANNPFVPDFAFCATQGSVAVRNATSWGCLTPGLNGQVLITQGAGANVAWSSAVGTGSVTSVALSLPSIFSVSGSPVTTSGTLTGTLATQTANTIFAGPTSGGAASPAFRALVGADLPNPSSTTLGGTRSQVAVANNFMTGISTSGIPTLAQPAFSNLSGQATIAQMPSIADGTIIGNVSGGTATAAAITPSAALDVIGNTRGSLLYRGASGWAEVTPGTASYVLTSNGTGADPTWQAVPASPASTTYSVVGALSATGTNTRTQTSIDSEDVMIMFDAVSIATSTGDVNIQYSTDNGSTWSSTVFTIGSIQSAENRYNSLFCTGLKAGYVNCNYGSGFNSTAIAAAQSSGSARIAAGTQINGLRFVTSTSTWNAGTIRIFGR